MLELEHAAGNPRWPDDTERLEEALADAKSDIHAHLAKHEGHIPGVGRFCIQFRFKRQEENAEGKEFTDWLEKYSLDKNKPYFNLPGVKSTKGVNYAPDEAGIQPSLRIEYYDFTGEDAEMVKEYALLCSQGKEGREDREGSEESIKAVAQEQQKIKAVTGVNSTQEAYTAVVLAQLVQAKEMDKNDACNQIAQFSSVKGVHSAAETFNAAMAYVKESQRESGYACIP